MLRPIKLEDYKIYNHLRVDEEEKYQWLYYPADKEEDDENKEYNYAEVSECLKEVKREILNYSMENFQEDLNSKYSYILGIEENNQIIGYVHLYYNGKNQYRIFEFALMDSTNEELIKQVLKEIMELKLPWKKSFDAMVTNTRAKQILSELGWENEDGIINFIWRTK